MDLGRSGFHGSAGEGEEDDACGAGLFEGRGTRAAGRARGAHVVNQCNAFVAEAIVGPNHWLKCALHVFESLFERKQGLSLRRANTHNRVGDQRLLKKFSKWCCNQLGLVEAALAQSNGMERHGDDDIERLEGQLVLPAKEHQPRHDGREFVVLVIFEFAHHLFARPSVNCRRPCAIERRFHLLAEAATLCAPLDLLAAAPTDRFEHLVHFVATTVANHLIRFGEPIAAKRANGREEEVNHIAREFTQRCENHI